VPTRFLNMINGLRKGYYCLNGNKKGDVKMNFGMIMQLLIIACGVYMMYWAVQMKITNNIPEMLVGKGFPIARAKDPEKFIEKTFPITLGTGILLFVIGVISALDVLALYPPAEVSLTLFLLAELIFYGKYLLKAQKKYLIGVEETKNKK